MNHINYVYILFCLLVHVPILYPSEKENRTRSKKTQLTNRETYLDSSKNFTLDKAEKITTR